MGAGVNQAVRFEQINPTRDSASCKVEFGDRRPVPETAPSPCANFVCDHRVRKRAGNKSASAQIERLLYLSGADVQKYDVVGEVVGNEKAIALGCRQYRKAGRIRGRGSHRSLAYPKRDF